MKNEHKRDIYYAKSYDGTIEKIYRNYGNAYNFCVKLIHKGIDCGIYVWDSRTHKMECIIGC